MPWVIVVCVPRWSVSPKRKVKPLNKYKVSHHFPASNLHFRRIKQRISRWLTLNWLFTKISVTNFASVGPPLTAKLEERRLKVIKPSGIAKPTPAAIQAEISGNSIKMLRVKAVGAVSPKPMASKRVKPPKGLLHRLAAKITLK